MTLRTPGALVRFCLVLLAAVFLHVGLHSAMADKAKVQLTKDSVKRLVDSFPRVKILAVSQALSKGKDLASVKSPLEAVMKFAGDAEVRAQADDAAKDHGFKDFEEWLRVAHATAAAYVQLKAGTSPDEMEKAAEKVIAQIRDTDFLTDKQKRKLEKKARKGLEEDGLLSSTQENMAAVKSMEKDLDALVKKGG
ncbi:MAG: hypothetical protein SGJ17_07950 [Hyphomicrobiales bacterium]|nr:hypothetical protein [Hyphomicrobiales bacterium]